MEEQQLDNTSPAQQCDCIFVADGDDDDDNDDDDEGWGDLNRGAVHVCVAVSSSDVCLISSSSQSSSSVLVSEEDGSAVSNNLAMEKDCLRADPKSLTDNRIPHIFSRTESTSSMSFNVASLSGNNVKEKDFLEKNPQDQLQSMAMNTVHEKESIEATIDCEIAMREVDLFSDHDGNCSMMELLGLHFPQMQQEVSSLLLAATSSKARTPKPPSPEVSDHNPVPQVIESTDFEANSWDVGVFKNFEGVFVPNSSRAVNTRASSEICVTTQAQWRDIDRRSMSYPAQGAEPPPPLTFSQMEAVIPPPIDLLHSEIHAAAMGTCISSVAEQKAENNEVSAADLCSSLSLKGVQIDLEMVTKTKTISSVKYEEEIYVEGRKPEAVLGSKASKLSFQNILIKPADNSTQALKQSEGCLEHKSRLSTGRNIQKASIEAQEGHRASKRLKRCISSTTSTKNTTANRISHDGEVIPDHKRTRSYSRAATVPALNTNLKPRARQGSASDPQSIAARHRRERISRRLKILQELIPNGSKVDLVTMLEKAINYVKYLQLQAKVLMDDDYWPREQRLGLPPYILQAATSTMFTPYHVAANLQEQHYVHPLINYQRL